MSYQYIGDNVSRIREACLARASALGLQPPTLLAVTKSASNEEVKALVDRFGQKHIAENRTSLFCERYDLFSDEDRPEMHLIGQLQTNKVKYIAGKTALIHSLDSERLAAEIEKQAAKRNIVMRALIEINSAREEAKGGIMPEDAERFFEKVSSDYPHIALCGIMTMGPVLAEAEEYRPYFRETAAIFQKLKEQHGFGDAPILSMGMSGSFVTAIEEGANMIRVGRALFVNPNV